MMKLDRARKTNQWLKKSVGQLQRLQTRGVLSVLSVLSGDPEKKIFENLSLFLMCPLALLRIAGQNGQNGQKSKSEGNAHTG